MFVVYEGNDQYRFDFGNKEIILTVDELREIQNFKIGKEYIQQDSFIFEPLERLSEYYQMKKDLGILISEVISKKYKKAINDYDVKKHTSKRH